MRRLNKKVSLTVASIVALMATLTGCAGLLPNNQGAKYPNPTELVFDVDTEMTIGYYEYCNVPEIVGEDEYGNLYFPVVEVRDGDNQIISLENGRFFVNSEGNYTFIYKLLFNGTTTVKTTTAIVKDKTAPDIELPYLNTSAFTGEKVTIPEAICSDNKDAKDTLECIPKVYFNDAEIELKSGGFVPSVEGVYEVKYFLTDKAGNKTTKSISVRAVDKDPNMIAYFNYPNGDIISNVTGNWNTTVEYSESGKYPNSTIGDGVLQVNPRYDSAYTAVVVGNPAIKNLTAYKYFYVDVFNPANEVVNFWINFKSGRPTVPLSANSWTRVVAKNDGNGNFTLVGSDNPTATIFGSGSGSVLATDITGMLLGLNVGKTYSFALGSMRVANELPHIEVDMQNVVIQGGTVDLNYQTVDADGANVEVSVLYNGVETAVTGSSYVCEQLGSYTFNFKLVKDGKTLDTKYHTVTTFEKDENAIAYLHKENGITISDVGGNWQAKLAYNATVDYPAVSGGKGALTVSSGQPYTGITVNAPHITNFTKYEYFYVDVYNPNDEAVDFFIFFRPNGPTVSLAAKAWTRVVAMKDDSGNFVLCGATGNITSGATGTAIFGSSVPAATNVEWIQMGILSNKAIYFGEMRAVNELPTLPEGMVSTYENTTPTPEPEPDPIPKPSGYVEGEGVRWLEIWNEIKK